MVINNFDIEELIQKEKLEDIIDVSNFKKLFQSDLNNNKIDEVIMLSSVLKWASDVTGTKYVDIGRPVALARQNKIFILEGFDKEKIVLRISPITATWIESGVYIRERLFKAGFNVPNEVSSRIFE